ncbi:MAG: iron-siderophore ABC transporter substrate-binding protein [Microbacterium sp.]
MTIRPALAIIASGALALTLTSCATGGDTAADDTSATESASANTAVDTTDYCADYTAAGDGYPTTITHALGTTTIDEQPQRVAAIGWGNQDVALALGVAPIGSDDQTWSWDMSDGLGLYEWTTDGYATLGADDPTIYSTTDGVDFEAISDSKPDLIIAGYSGLTADDYATLSKIAPTVAYPDVAWYTPWRDVICIDSAALGLPVEGQALVDSLEDDITAATTDVDFSGNTAAFFYMDGSDLSTISIYAEGDGRTAFLKDLGFAMPEIAVSAGENGSFYQDISSENADQLEDVDVIVSYGDGDDLLKALQADPLWSTLPAVQNGAVVTVGSGDAYSGAVTPTALSIPWVLDQYVSDLSAGAALAK